MGRIFQLLSSMSTHISNDGNTNFSRVLGVRKVNVHLNAQSHTMLLERSKLLHRGFTQ